MSGLTRARADELLGKGPRDFPTDADFHAWRMGMTNVETLLYRVGFAGGCWVEDLLIEAASEAVRSESVLSFYERDASSADYLEAIRWCNCQCERCKEARG